MQTIKGRWALSPSVGQAPSARAGHTCATLGDVTYLFGGFDGSARLRDLHAYHHPSSHGGKGGGQWTAEVAEEDCPPARSSHSVVFSHKQMIVFGGYDGAKSLNDLQAYDVTTGNWKEMVGRGKAPSPRFGHSAVMYKEDKMYIFGGYDGVDRNDLYCFDFELMQWNAVLVKQGNAPPPRQYHSAVVYEDEMFVFGGKNGTKHYHDLHAFNFRTQAWRAITAESVVKPWPRAGHTAVAQGPLMLIFGGMNGKQNFNDLSLYSIKTNRWTVVNVEGESPAERRAHSAVIANGAHLCVFGGSDGAKRFADIYSFDLSVLQGFDDISTNGTSGASLSAGMSSSGEQAFTPSVPPPTEWRQNRARGGTVTSVSPRETDAATANARRGTISQMPSTAAAARPSKVEDVPKKDEAKDKIVRNGEGDGKKDSAASGDDEERDREHRNKEKKEKKKKDKSDVKRREKEEKEKEKEQEQETVPSPRAENGASADTGNGTSAVATPSAASPRENGSPPVSPSSSAPTNQASAGRTSPERPSAGAASSSLPATPVKLEERGGSRIALLKARFDASSGSPSASGSPIRNVSRRSVAYPLSQHADIDESRALQNVEVEKLQKEMAELRSMLEERDREVAALKERLDARDAELQKLADGVAKQMKKMRRDLKKVKAEKKDKKSGAADEKKTKKGETTN